MEDMISESDTHRPEFCRTASQPAGRPHTLSPLFFFPNIKSRARTSRLTLRPPGYAFKPRISLLLNPGQLHEYDKKQDQNKQNKTGEGGSQSPLRHTRPRLLTLDFPSLSPSRAPLTKTTPVSPGGLGAKAATEFSGAETKSRKVG